MGPTVIKILIGIISSLVTEKVIIEVALILLDKLVKSTKNELDDKLLEVVKENLQKK